MAGRSTRTDEPAESTSIAAFDVAPELVDSATESNPVAPADGEDAVPDEAA
jgi:hypothetical protein